MQTPLEEQSQLAEALGIPRLFFKREDLHPYGSHKGRSLPFMIDHYLGQGKHAFVIASSGNAALAAGLYLMEQQDIAYTLTIFIGENIAPKKEELLRTKLQAQEITIKKVTRPQQEAFVASKESDVVNLRQSRDPLALEGYTNLAQEIGELSAIDALFVPTSSGTTAEALATFLPHVPLHIVQTSSIHPIAEVFDTTTPPDEASLAGAIVDRVAHRKSGLVEKIKETNGSGWIVTNTEIAAAQNIVKEKSGLDISPNSALSIAGLQRALAEGATYTDPVVCLITGQ